jgi:hypothetical protein
MNKNVTIKTYIINNNNEQIEDNEYIFNLNDKIIDIKNKILNNTFKNKYNHLEIINITEKVYKDYGKLFFDKGLLPSSIDNYTLSQFTNEDRIFSFLIKGKNVEKIIHKHNDKDSFIKKIIKEDRKNSEFKLYDDDFPPLPSIKK